MQPDPARARFLWKFISDRAGEAYWKEAAKTKDKYNSPSVKYPGVCLENPGDDEEHANYFVLWEETLGGYKGVWVRVFARGPSGCAVAPGFQTERYSAYKNSVLVSLNMIFETNQWSKNKKAGRATKTAFEETLQFLAGAGRTSPPSEGFCAALGAVQASFESPLPEWPQEPHPQEHKATTENSIRVKTPAQILDESRASIAEIVAVNDTSTKLGTGFFLRSSGLLLTNFHVVEGTELVGVKLAGSTDVLWARMARGFDLDNDLAALQVEVGARTVPTLQLGNSDSVRVGEPVVVVGNPEGLEQTVSNGLIRAIIYLTD